MFGKLLLALYCACPCRARKHTSGKRHSAGGVGLAHRGQSNGRRHDGGGNQRGTAGGGGHLDWNEMHQAFRIVRGLAGPDAGSAGGRAGGGDAEDSGNSRDNALKVQDFMPEAVSVVGR